MTDSAHPGAALSEARRALLIRRLRGDAPAVERPGIPRRSDPGPDFPMSFAQERMWFADQLEPGTPLYHVAAATLINADADLPTLERALTEVRRRHEALRTVYSMRDGQPIQTVLPATPWRVETEDIRAALDAAPDRDAELQRRLSIEGKRPFDLARGPVCRAKVFRISDEDAVLSLTVHHIATDGWAMPIISGEMSTLYDAFLAGRPSPLPEPVIQYADYTLWQRDYLRGRVLERQLGYWKERLAGAPPLDLPGDHPRPAVSTHKGDFHRFTIGAEVTDAVRTLARREGVTVNMVVMAAFNVLLARWTGQDDITVGTLLGNRNRKETEELVGVTVNTAATRCDLSAEPTFLELIGQVRRHTLDSDEHQDLPFERVVDALGLERDLSRHPVFQVMYFHHTFVGSHKQGGSGLNVRPLYAYGVSLVDIHIAQFDLSLATLELQGGLSCLIEYSTDLFGRESILRFSDHLEETLRQVAAHPDLPVSAFAVMGDGERRRVVEEWSHGPAAGADAALPVHERFAAAAARTPQAPAVVAAGATLSYAELEARANRLAHWLRARGVGPEARVGVCTERSPEMVVAVLGVLKAGAAYVPMDPRLPAERLAFLAADSGAALVLTQASLAGLFAGVETLRLDADGGALEALPATAPGVAALPESLAYLIYTSGSTGLPKAVMVPHGALANFVVGAVELYGITAADRVLQFASLSFDASNEEIFTALATGAALVLRTEEMLDSVPALLEGIAAAGVTTASLPTALWHEVAAQLDAAGTRLPPSLRLLVLGGERALPERLAAWLRVAGPEVRTINSYGPTEATVAATAWEAGGAPPQHEVPIGRPMAGARALVLDRALRPVPVGVAGELFLGGACLARGYLGRPEATAAAFVPDPFSARPGARLYRTGDRVRWLATGELEFLGRADDQVKVRGFRVELGEIDAALAADPRVREAVTVLRETAPGQKRLVAYVAAAAPDDGSLAAALRGSLRERLPEYMVPSAVVVLEALPLTSSGKIDRRALPSPDAAPADPAGFAAPESATERTLARIWAEALKLERVGLHDNFFELGGDSILSIQVIARAAAEGLRLTPKLLFQHQTVADLAPYVGTAAEVQAEQGPVVGTAPLTPIQRLFFEHFEAAPEVLHHWNQAFLFTVRERLSAATLERAVAAVLEHHDALRLRYGRGADGWVQRFAAPGGAVPLETVDVGTLPAGERGAAVSARCAEIQAGLELADGPIARFALFEGLEDGRQRLLLAIHHLAVDAVSWGTLLGDLATAYAQTEAGEPTALPAKTSSFRQWAERLAEYAGSDELRREAAYWGAAVPSPSAPLPTDRAGGNPEAAADVVQVELDEAETRALLQEVPPVYGTQINDVLLAALAQAFGAWTGRRSLLIDLEGHGREDLFDDVDLSRTVGWFTSLFPVHLELPEGGGAGEALKAVKETLRAIPGRGIGYGLLRYLCPDEDLATMLRVQPRAQVSFNYLGQFDGGAGASGSEEPLFAPAPESPGPVRAPAAEREHLLEIDGMVAGGRLRLNWWFATGVHDRATVERLADGYVAALRGLIEHCKDPTAGGFTPSDFPAAVGLDQGALDALLAQLGE